jgi:uncharacterized protein (TIGR03437 family)
MRRATGLLGICLAVAGLVEARQVRSICGTTREKWKEQLDLHRQAVRLRGAAALRAESPRAAQTRTGARDFGNIAVLDDSDGVVARLNEFNLDQRTVTFWPASSGATRYRFGVGDNSYDPAAASSGARIEGLGDDDARQVPLPFPFPFFGASYQQVFVNSDGNLTFTASDTTSFERSLGRMTSGPPRIAGLFRDLDPSVSNRGVTVFSSADRWVVSWVGVPEYRDYGVGPLQTFQIRLFPDGRIEFAYAGINTASALVGISPGRFQGSSSVVTFVSGSSQEFSSSIAERFGRANEVDVITAAQKFYATHDDAYDYLVFFNNLGIEAMELAVSYELTLRSRGRGFGDEPIDVGAEFGSPARLQSVLNLGPLDQFPDDPNKIVDARVLSRDTPLTILAHEAGHLFLAYASVRDPQNPRARPMLGFQEAHWAFVFNSEASLLEGNRIRDNWELQPGTSLRFTTIGVTEGFSPLDQYLMGLRAPQEVPGTFLVTGSRTDPERHPQVGVSFSGERRDIRLEEVIQAEGRRTPDHTVAQRRFRFAFILIAAQGADPSAADLQKIENFRQQFETYFRKATSERAWADTSLRRALGLSTFPAAGVVQGGTIPAAVTLEKPAEARLTVDLRAENGLAGVPSSISIPAGETRAAFTISGLGAGVEELVASAGDARYQTAYSRLQVAPSLTAVKLVVVSGDKQPASAGVPLPAPIVLRVVDDNDLPYPGLRVRASVSSGGAVSPALATTDESGAVSFRWTPAADPVNQLRAVIEGAAPSSAVMVSALGKPFLTAASVVNAASYQPGLSPGSLGTIFGVNLSANPTISSLLLGLPDAVASLVSLNGKLVPLLYVSDTQINFLAPADVPQGTADLVVTTSVGASAVVRIPVEAVSPGIFFDPATGLGAIRVAGDFVEIYATGLGPVHLASGFQQTDLTPQVFIGSVAAPEISYSGLAPGFLGVYQVNARIPPGVPAGMQPLYLVINGRRSNEVKVQIR